MCTTACRLCVLTFRVEGIEILRLFKTFGIVDQCDDRIEKTVDGDRRARINNAFFQMACTLRKIISRTRHLIDHSVLTFKGR